MISVPETHRSPTNRRETIYKKDAPNTTRQLFKISPDHDTPVSTFISTSNDCFSFPATNSSPIRASSLRHTPSRLSSNNDENNENIRLTGRRNKSANDCQYNNKYKNNDNNSGTDFGKYTIPNVGPRSGSIYNTSMVKTNENGNEIVYETMTLSRKYSSILSNSVPNSVSDSNSNSTSPSNCNLNSPSMCSTSTLTSIPTSTSTKTSTLILSSPLPLPSLARFNKTLKIQCNDSISELDVIRENGDNRNDKNQNNDHEDDDHDQDDNQDDNENTNLSGIESEDGKMKEKVNVVENTKIEMEK